jgi:hypothetical protein
MPDAPTANMFFDAAEKVVLVAAGGLAVEIFRWLKTRNQLKALSGKTAAEASAIHQSEQLKAFAVADESAAEWMATARQATRDLLQAIRKLNQSEMFVDEALGMLERAVTGLDDCGVEGFDGLKRDIRALIKERTEYLRSQNEHLQVEADRRGTE